jgi:hypothetical protein
VFSTFFGIYYLVLAFVFLLSGDLCLTFTLALFGYALLNVEQSRQNVINASDPSLDR